MTVSPEPSPAAPVDTGAVDAENPWPGLAAFREVDQELFHGRGRETEELLRRVLRERLTVLFGLSGLGKTSLLQAGLFPRLRQEKILPVSIRLDYSGSRRPLTGQILDALTRATQADRVEAPAPRDGETLWELFHRKDAELWSARNRLLTPLLVFDQFEEIFTLGQQDAERTRETALLIAELAALCEGAPPREVRARLDANPEEIRQLDFNRHPYKVLFSLREDFLPHLEALRRQIASLAHNRMRLLGMTGENALQVVIQGEGTDRPSLVDSGTAVKVVRFVASQDEEDIPLSDLDIEPALLSFVCRELNNKRRLQGGAQISADLLQGTRETVFVDFYERSVGDIDAQVRTFIEDRLLTKSGYRDSVALETAREAPSITSEVLTVLTARRLLRIEDRGGLPRIELTHDVLTGVIKSSRDTRRQREEQAKADAARQEAEKREDDARRKLRRSRLVIATLGLLLLGVLGLAWWGWKAQRMAREALASAEVERALHTLQEGHSAPALAYLAHAMRIDPENPQARNWLTGLLLQRAWLVPSQELQKVDALQGMRFSQDGKSILVFDTKRAWVWDTATGDHAGPSLPIGGLQEAALSQEGRLLFTLDQAGHGRLWDVGTGEPVGTGLSLGNVLSFELSPDGQLVAAVTKEGTIDLYETMTGALSHHISLRERRITTVVFGSRSSVLVAVSRPDSWPREPEEIVLWDTQRAAVSPLPAASGYHRFKRWPLQDREHPSLIRLIPGGRIAASKIGFDVGWVDFTSDAGPGLISKLENFPAFDVSQDGRVVVTLSPDHRLQVWSGETHQALAEPLEGIVGASISPDGFLLATVSLDGQVRLWPLRPARSEPGRIAFEPGTYLVRISPKGDRIAAFSTGKARFWSLSSLLPLGDSFPVPFHVSDARFSADGETLAAIGGKALGVWSLRTAAHASFPGLRFVDVSPDGRKVVTSSTNNTAQIWDMPALGPPKILPHNGPLTTVRFSPDGRFVVTSSKDRTARLWSAETGDAVGLPMRHGGPVYWAKFSPDGQRIVTTAGGRELFLWQSPSGQLERTLSHGQTDYYVELSHDGDRMVTTSIDGAVWVWTRQFGHLLAGPLRPPEGQVSQIAISPDGERFAILVPRAPEVRIWNLQSGEPLGDTIRQEGATFWDTAQFTADGQRLVVAGNEEALVWDIPLFPQREAADLAALAEVAASSAVTENGKLAALPFWTTWLLANTDRRDIPAGQASTSSLARWLFADPWTRTISPLSKITVPELIRRRLADGTGKEAERAYPGHPLLPPKPAAPASGTLSL